MKRSISLIPAVVLALAAGSAWAAPESPKCKPVTGRFEAVTVPPGQDFCTEGIGFCTAGRVWGGIQGEYQFVMLAALDSGIEPSILFFNGRSTIFLKSGDQVEGNDTGAVDLRPGGFASLITFRAGTGAMAAATGQIRLRGDVTVLDDPTLQARTSGDYTGTLCTP